MENKRKITLYDMILVGLMTAIIFAITSFVQIKIPTPSGTTMIKLANAFCLLAGILLGGWRGGLAAGLGSAFYDLTYPEYAYEAWITFIRFFFMAYICGKIAYAGGALGKKTLYNTLGAVAGAVFSMAFYIGKNILVLMAAGSAFLPAFYGTLPKAAASVTNMVIGIVVCTALALPMRKAIEPLRIYKSQEL